MDAMWKRAFRAAGDNQFGPGSADYPDFTLGFEDAILTLPAGLIFLFLTPFYVRYYVKSPIVTTEEPLIWAKAGTNSALIILQVVSAVFYNSPNGSTRLSLAASVVECLAALALAIFMHFEHRQALESSPLPALYLFVTVLLDITKTRSYFLRSDNGLYPLACITAAIVALEVALLILDELPKRYHAKVDNIGSEASQGFWGRSLFIWVNSTLFLGFRSILSPKDLPNLDPSFSSARLAAEFEPVWERCKKSPSRLMRATFWTQKWSLLAAAPPRLLQTGFTFAEPFLLRRIIQQLARKKEEETISGLIGAMALVHIGATITRTWYNHRNNRLVAKVRGVLISQILRKNLLLRPNESKRSAASTVMSTDVDGIVMAIPAIHEIWASVLELGLSIYFLCALILQPGFLVIFPAILTTVISLEVGRRLAVGVKSWNGKTEERVTATSQVLSQLRGIKMIAAESAVGDYLQSLRQEEVACSKIVRKLGIVTMTGLQISYAITPIVIIAAGLYWNGFTDGFNAADLFTALAFIYLASQPMAVILNYWSKFGGLTACFSRIQAYLLIEEQVDSRERILEPTDDKTTLVGQRRPPHDIYSFPVQLVNVTVSTLEDRALFSADVVFTRETTTMIIGPTGVGKSTFLKGLLGEANITSGSVFVPPQQQIAYCGQEEWICNITIRENIIGGNIYDEGLYNRVVEACLLYDLNEFPNGDETVAGSHGSSLSGGQRQRVALARAAYSRAAIVVLDDPLSALDRVSSTSILKRLVGPDGLLRSLGSTVIMSTHSVEMVRSADKVLVMQADGTVTTQSPETAIEKFVGKGFLDNLPDDGEDMSDECSQQVSPDTRRQAEPPEPTPNASTSERQIGDLAIYKYYWKSVTPWVFLLWLFVQALVSLSEKAPDIYLRLWVEKDPENKSLFIGYALIGVPILVSTVLWAGIFFVRLVPESAERLHRVVLDAVTNATMSFITHTDSGELLNRFSQDMSLIIRDLPSALLFSVSSIFDLSIVIGIIVSSVEFAATAIPLLLAILYGVQLFYLRTSRQLRLLDIEAKVPIYTHLTECGEGVEHIRAFRWEKEYLSKGLDLLDQSQKPFYFRFCLQRWLGLVLNLVVAATGVFLVALALYRGSTTQAALGLGLLKVMQIGPDLIYSFEQWVDLETSLGALTRIRSFEKETPREGTEAGRDGDSSVPENWPQQGHIQANNVTANYGLHGVDSAALRGVTVDIRPGTKVDLVGRSGSGKSSFLLTLLNFLQFSGSITIDGIDITTIPRRLLRSRITTISQEFTSLPSSVRNNLVPLEIMKEAGAEDRTSDKKLFDALEKVGLKSIIESRGGLDRLLEEVGLSAGERQLLALARALVHRSHVRGKVIFVDEATSHIDYESEAKLKEVTREAFEDCTVLTIAHRHNGSDRNDSTRLELSAGQVVRFE